MGTLKTDQSRIFHGRVLPFVNIQETEAASPKEALLFEVVRGDGWHRLRYGFLIARSSDGTRRFTEIIKAYRQAYPGAELYLNGRD